jgi:hypothetical protein
VAPRRRALTKSRQQPALSPSLIIQWVASPVCLPLSQDADLKNRCGGSPAPARRCCRGTGGGATGVTCAGGSWRCCRGAASQDLDGRRRSLYHACRPVGALWCRVLQFLHRHSPVLSRVIHCCFSPPQILGCSCIVPSSSLEGKMDRRIRAHRSHRLIATGGSISVACVSSPSILFPRPNTTMEQRAYICAFLLFFLLRLP